ncbi:MAG TPA: lysophospholipid acyltransferase family protein [Caulobacteraceae bacterium]|jgi:1-acyl-sn-glycerol-3-phosphate acyltransferase
MRAFAFNVAYWALSITYGLAAAIAAALPGRDATAAVVRRYTERMVQAMRAIGGIQMEVLGRERLPEGPFIIASKHQSWGDGFSVYAHVDDVVVVIGEHMEKLPLISTILRKLRSVVVRKTGARETREAMRRQGEWARREHCRILIYPEGALAKVGEKFTYQSGVWRMSRDFELPVVPVASNLGLFWPQKATHRTRPGTATVEFLEPIPSGLPKAEFMARLEAVIEDRTAELIAQAAGREVAPAVWAPTPTD